MLFKDPILKRIATGEVTKAFRIWKRPTVKSGGTLQTSVGLLAIDELVAVDRKGITTQQAQAAGYADLPELLAKLDAGREGTLYQISIHVAGPDPRIELRNQAEITSDEVTHLREKLRRLDDRSPTGPWTLSALRLIEKYPERPAGDLAPLIGMEKERFKTNIRKLKNLGLTESLLPGYRLSPRGAFFLRIVAKGEAGTHE